MKTHIRRAGMGKWMIALAFAMLVGTSAIPATPGPDTSTATQQISQNRGYFMKGKFLDIVQGDDLILVLLDQNGKRRAFYVSETFPRAELDPFLLDPSLKGKSVEITWRKVDRLLKTAGTHRKVDEVTSMTLVGN